MRMRSFEGRREELSLKRRRLAMIAFPLLLSFSIVIFFIIQHNFDEDDLLGTKLQPKFPHTKGCHAAASKAVLLGSLRNDKLNVIGGTSHWFHLTERILPLLDSASSNVWENGNESELSDISIGNDGMMVDNFLYILFREKNSVKDLNLFGQMILTMVISGGYFDGVHFGYVTNVEEVVENDSCNVNNGKGTEKNSSISRILIQGIFHHQYTVSRKHSKHGAYQFGRKSENNQYIHKPDSERIFHLLLGGLTGDQQLHWIPIKDRLAWFPAENSRYQKFIEAAARVCQIPTSSSSPHAKIVAPTTTPPSTRSTSNPLPLIEDDMVSSSPWLVSKYKRGYGRWLPMSHIHNAAVALGAPRNILIYQRDKSRALLNPNAIANELKQALDAKFSYNGYNGSVMQQSVWNITVLVHSEERDPCDLVRLLSNTTVLITSHGFQSTLLLFQPQASLLIEVFPYMYFRPEVYGFIQGGLRHRTGLSSRSYLAHESTPSNWIWRILDHAKTSNMLSKRFCEDTSICRFFSRRQEVSISPAFLMRIVNYIHQHFPP